jgi:hypothetical protein
MSSKIGPRILMILGLIITVIGLLGVAAMSCTKPCTISPYSTKELAYEAIMIVLSQMVLPSIAMIIVGAAWNRKINKKRTNLPNISKHLQSGEQVIQTWPSEVKKGILGKKYVILTLTNQRILTVNTDSKKIEESMSLIGLSPIAKNRQLKTVSYGSYKSTDNYSPRNSTTTQYGDIDFFKDGVIVYQLFNIPDVDAVVETIKRVTQNY